MIENCSRASLDDREESRYLSARPYKGSQSKRKLKINQKYYDHKNSQASSSLYFSNLKSPNSMT